MTGSTPQLLGSQRGLVEQDDAELERRTDVFKVDDIEVAAESLGVDPTELADELNVAEPTRVSFGDGVLHSAKIESRTRRVLLVISLALAGVVVNALAVRYIWPFVLNWWGWDV